MSNYISATRVQTRILRGDAAKVASSALRDDVITAFDPTKVAVALNPAEAAEKARVDAFEQGYNEGLAAAMRDVEAATEDANKRVRRALAALCEAVDSFENRQAVALTEVEDAILAGAVQLAQAILQQEVAVSDDPGSAAIARAMQLAPDRGDVIARLHPEDAATLNTQSISTSTRTVTVIADPAVEPGGALVEVGETRIDAQLSSALEKAADAMGAAYARTRMTRADSGAAGRSSKPSRKTAEETPLS